jgi:hypothetical protein
LAIGVDGATRFLDGIPKCGTVPALMTARDAREQPEGTKIAVRGVLLHNPKWNCPPKGCAGKTGADGRRGGAGCCNTCRTRWFVVDPADAARPYMSRARLYPRIGAQPELATLEAQDCPGLTFADSSDIDSDLVVLRARVRADGQVLDVKVIDAPDSDIAEDVVACVHDWRFQPALNDHGEPIAALSPPLRVRFRL